MPEYQFLDSYALAVEDLIDLDFDNVSIKHIEDEYSPGHGPWTASNPSLPSTFSTSLYDRRQTTVHDGGCRERTFMTTRSVESLKVSPS